MDPMKATGPSPVPSPVPSPLPSPEQSSNRALVVTTSSSASARRMALESLRITSSAASGSAGLGGYLVQRVERKSDEPDERALVTGPMGGPVGGPGDGPVTPPSGRPLRAAGARSPAMERFTSLARTSSALPLSRKAALRELEDSEGQLRRQMLCVVSDAQLQAGGDRAFAQGCRRLLALDTSGAGLVGLVAGALALELEPKAARESRQDTKAGAGRVAHYPQQADRERLVDAVLEAAQDEAARDGAA